MPDFPAVKFFVSVTKILKAVDFKSLTRFFSVLLLIISFMGMWQTYNSQQGLLIAEEQYVQTIAKQAAKQISVFVVRDDLISLQAHLNALVGMPFFMGASIYSLENDILVQAGVLPAQVQQENGWLDLSISISEDDNLIGRLALIQQAHKKSYVFLLWLIPAFFSLWIYWVLHFSLKNSFAATSSSVVSENEAVEVIADTEKTMALASEKVILHLKLNRLDALYQQLNAERRKQQFGQLDSVLEKTLALYSGHLVCCDQDRFTVVFEASELAEAVFNALCAGDLLLKVAEKEHWLICPSVVIMPSELSDKPSEWLSYSYQSADQLSGVNAQKSLLDAIDLKEKIELAENRGDEKIVPVKSLNEKYQKLIEKQLSTILNSVS